MAQVALVANPAKVGDVDALRARIEQRLTAAGWPEPMVLSTTQEDPGRGPAEEAIRSGADVVIAAGGDGTVAAVASALSGTQASLAVLPAGTGNLLARNLDLPTEVDEVLDAVLAGAGWRMDLGEVVVGPAAGSSFAVMAGLGFDAHVVADAPEQLKSAVGWPAYVVSALGHLTDDPFECTIQLDGGEPLVRSARTVLVANASQLQAGLDLAPDAGVADGVLDVIVISPEGLADWARIGSRVLTGSNRDTEPMERFQARRIEISTARAQMCQLDGDPIGEADRLVVEVRPGALRIVAAG
jgi:YegS/Rv2252/BmrU family lipid kinase